MKLLPVSVSPACEPQPPPPAGRGASIQAARVLAGTSEAGSAWTEASTLINSTSPEQAQPDTAVVSPVTLPAAGGPPVTTSHAAGVRSPTPPQAVHNPGREAPVHVLARPKAGVHRHDHF